MFRLLFNAFLFLISFVDIAHAAFVGAAISAIATFAGTAIGKIVLMVGLNIAGSLLQKAMQKDRTQQSGIRTEVKLGGDGSLAFIVGTYATAGTREYVNTYGEVDKTENAFLTQVFTLSDLPVTSVQSRIWISGEQCTISGTNDSGGKGRVISEYTRDSKPNLWAKTRLGTDLIADTFLVGSFNGVNPWTSDMIGRGVAMGILTAKFNRELFTQMPSAIWEVNGIALYDPRKDSTVGGSGSHRWGQPNTYEFSNNPVVIIYNIMRGIFYNGAWVYGPQVPATRLPFANWVAAMNACDVSVALSGGGSERKYRAGCEIETNVEPVDYIEDLLKACHGRMAEIGGIYKIHVGATPLPVYFFSDEDIVITEGQTFDPFPSYEKIYNGAAALYPEPLAAWANKDAPQYINSLLVAEDNGDERLSSLKFNSVPFPNQVQRLMRALILDNRRFRRHEFSLPPETFVFEPLDCFSYTSAENGYENKLFIATGSEDQENLNQAFALLENDPSDFDWSPDFELPWSVGPLLPSWPAPQMIFGWQVGPATIRDAVGNARRPSIEVRFAGDQDDVRAVRVLVRLASTDEIIFDGNIPYGEPTEEPSLKITVLNGTFLPNEVYEVRGQFIPYSGRKTTPSAWLTVTTPNVKLYPGLDFDPFDGVVGLDRLDQDVKNYFDFTGGSLRQLINQAQAQATITSDQELANFRQIQKVRQEIAVIYGTAEASWTQDIIVATGPGSAIVKQITELEAKVDEDIAEAIALLQTEITTIDGKVIASADAITALNAATSVGDVNTANFRMSVMTGPTGYSRIGAEARQGGAGAWRTAAWFMDVPNNPALPTRFLTTADQFMFLVDAAAEPVFIADAGGLRIRNALVKDLTAANILAGSIGANELNVTTLSAITGNVGTLTAGIIRSANSKMIINLNNATLEIFT